MWYPDEVEHLMALARLLALWLSRRWRTARSRSETGPCKGSGGSNGAIASGDHD
jgi:hypothetical protein